MTEDSCTASESGTRKNKATRWQRFGPSPRRSRSSGARRVPRLLWAAPSPAGGSRKALSGARARVHAARDIGSPALAGRAAACGRPPLVPPGQRRGGPRCPLNRASRLATREDVHLRARAASPDARVSGQRDTRRGHLCTGSDVARHAASRARGRRAHRASEGGPL